MKLFLKYIFGLILFFHITTNLQAQLNSNFPVNINPVLFPPYPFSINYLNVATKPNLRLIINHKSSNASVLNGLLKVIIKTNNFIAQTKSFDVAYPVTLVGNSPITLTNEDISSLFIYSNLMGITSQQYYSEFPQSTVSISFVLYESITKRQISQVSNYTYVFTKENPPLLSMPDNDSTFIDNGFPNILFQWVPRQASPIGSVRYIFEMVETSVAFPQTAVVALASNNIFFTDSTYSTTYFYNASNPMLKPEFQYSWRVRAVAADYGGFTNSVFINNGFSDSRRIYFTTPCVLPGNIQITPDTTSINISWSKLSNRQSITFYSQLISKDAFTDNYNKTHNIAVQSIQSDQSINADNTSTEGWTNLGVATANSGESYRINNLLSNATYKIKWKAECQTPVAHLQAPILYSNPTNVNTKDPDSTLKAFITAQSLINAVCGKLPENTTLSQTLLSSLNVNDVIQAGDFNIIIKTGVTGANGIFTGTGIIDMWIGKVFKATVSFENIKINQDKKLIDGYIKLISPL